MPVIRPYAARRHAPQPPRLWEMIAHRQLPLLTIAKTRALAITSHPFVAKIKEDDITRLAPMIAFNMLMSLVPIMVLILVLLGFILSGFAPHARDHLLALVSEKTLQGQFFKLALYRLSSMPGWAVAFIIVLPSFWFGSELFVVIEHCFTRIFHTRPRPFVHQRLMALRMLGIFVVVIPLLLAVSMVPTFLKKNVLPTIYGHTALTQLVLFLTTFIIDWLIVSCFFAIMYLVVPGGRVRHVWKGALAAGILLALYAAAFPRLEGSDLTPKNDAANAGFALAAIAFFYFFSIFLLLGAEINAYWGGMFQQAKKQQDCEQIGS